MTDLVARRDFLPAMLSVEEFEAESSQAMGVRSPDAVAEKVSTSAQHALVCVGGLRFDACFRELRMLSPPPTHILYA